MYPLLIILVIVSFLTEIFIFYFLLNWIFRKIFNRHRGAKGIMFKVLILGLSILISIVTIPLLTILTYLVLGYPASVC